jgi:hypothetical protein
MDEGRADTAAWRTRFQFGPPQNRLAILAKVGGWNNDQAVDFHISATANGGNYTLDVDTISRLLNNGAFKYVPRDDYGD